MEQSYNQLKDQIQEVTGLKIDFRMEGTKYIQSYEVDYSNVDFDKLQEILHLRKRQRITSKSYNLYSMPDLQELTNHKLIERNSIK